MTTTDTQRGASGSETHMTTAREREQWDELAAAAHRLNRFCWLIDALRGNENSDVSEEINFMERAACAEAQHIGELVASIPSLLGEPGEHCAIEPTGANRFCTESDR
jgi:hypothetical protein